MLVVRGTQKAVDPIAEGQGETEDVGSLPAEAAAAVDEAAVLPGDVGAPPAEPDAAIDDSMVQAEAVGVPRRSGMSPSTSVMWSPTRRVCSMPTIVETSGMSWTSMVERRPATSARGQAFFGSDAFGVPAKRLIGEHRQKKVEINVVSAACPSVFRGWNAALYLKAYPLVILP